MFFHNPPSISPSPSFPQLQVGNKTECALLGLVHDMGQSYETIRDAHPEETLVKVLVPGGGGWFVVLRRRMSSSGVYLQLGPKMHDDCDQEAWRGLSPLRKGCFRDHTLEVI
jgi:hypothetical protein